MQIITLTTDMGTRDYYVASVKAAILGLHPQAQIIDISHHIAPFDIAQAAFVLKNVYSDFPPGTIHIIGVNSEKTNALTNARTALIRHVVVQHKGHFFIGADNGVFSLLLDSTPEKVFEIDFDLKENEINFPVRNVFARTAAMIASGQQLTAFAKSINSLNQSAILTATVSSGLIKGTVIYIDTYGNVITNITRQMFYEHVGLKAFNILLRGSDYDITEIRQTYAEVPEGEIAALFDSTGHLEIAINKGVEGNGGGASGLLGLHIGDTVRMEF